MGSSLGLHAVPRRGRRSIENSLQERRRSFLDPAFSLQRRPYTLHFFFPLLRLAFARVFDKVALPKNEDFFVVSRLFSVAALHDYLPLFGKIFLSLSSFPALVSPPSSITDGELVRENLDL